MTKCFKGNGAEIKRDFAVWLYTALHRQIGITLVFLVKLTKILFVLSERDSKTIYRSRLQNVNICFTSEDILT